MSPQIGLGKCQRDSHSTVHHFTITTIQYCSRLLITFKYSRI